MLLDLGLPGGDGLVVLERLQRRPSLAAVPVIVVTGRDPGNYRETAQRAGVRAFFRKPVDDRELLAAIRAALGAAPAS